MTVSPPFQITPEDVARSSLETEDAGLWAILVCGCFHLFETEARARHAYRLLLQDCALR